MALTIDKLIINKLREFYTQLKGFYMRSIKRKPLKTPEEITLL